MKVIREPGRAGERVLILSAGVGSGHNSAAAALREAFASRADVADVEVIDVLEVSGALYRDLLAKGYFALVEGAPWLVSWGYDISDQPYRRRGPVDPWTRVNAMPAIRALRRFRPTVVVCTHFLPAQLIAAMLLRGALDARTAVVTTDYDVQGLWLATAFHEFFVARDEGREQLIELGLPADRVTASGIPIRPVGDPRPGEAGGPPPRILVSAGASGGGYAAPIVQQLKRLVTDFRATVVCGRNAELREQIATMVDGDDRFEAIGFTDAMPELMSRASLFVGKPGGLSASECMAAGLPMVLVNPIPGQEVRNGDYLLEEGAAVRCNTVATIGWKIDRILRDPERLRSMRARAIAVGRPAAAASIAAAVIDSAGPPLIVSRRAQRSMADASETRRAAAELEGDEALVQLRDDASGRTIALLGQAELQRLRSSLPSERGALLLDSDAADRLGAGWGVRRLARQVVSSGGTVRLSVRVLGGR